MAQLPPLAGKNFSRAKVRNGQKKLQEFYSQAGYFDAVVDFSIDERTTDPATGDGLFKILFKIKHKPNALADDSITPKSGALARRRGSKGLYWPRFGCR